MDRSFLVTVMESNVCQADESLCKIITTVTVEKPCNSVARPLKVVTSVTIDETGQNCCSRLNILPDYKPPTEKDFGSVSDNNLNPAEESNQCKNDFDINYLPSNEGDSKHYKNTPFKEFSADFFEVRVKECFLNLNYFTFS